MIFRIISDLNCRFKLVYTVDLGENDLKLTLTINNTGNEFLIGFFVCFVFFCPTQEFFTLMEMSSLPIKGCKF